MNKVWMEKQEWRGVPGKQEQLWNLSQDSMKIIIAEVPIEKSAAAKCNAHIIYYLLQAYKP